MRVTQKSSCSFIGQDPWHSFRALRANRTLARLIAIGLVGCASLVSPPATAPLSAQERGEGGGRAVLANLQDAFTSIAEELEPTVVTVSATKALTAAEAPRIIDSAARRAVGTGTGLIVRKDGWILTNDHVVSGADRVTVKFHDGRELPGTVLRDPRSDLAMVKVESKSPLPVAKLGDSDKVKIGQWAIAIGSPYKFEGSLSVGVISSLFRRQEIEDATAPTGSIRLYPNMIQTDAAINPGNSGGPLCNLNGEVIGINTAIQSPQREGGSIGIGFAIPINTAKYVMNQLLEKGHVTYGFLGVSPTTVTPRQATALKVDSGALIFREPPTDSPAGRAGLHAGDVITSIGGKAVHNEIDLRTIVSQTEPSTKIDIKFVRDGQPKVVTAMLERVEEEVQPVKNKANDKPSLGLEVDKLTDNLAARSGIPRNTAGVYVKSIDPNSSAAEDEDPGSLSDGCVILRVNDTDTPTVEAYKEATANLKVGDQVRITYLIALRGEGVVKRFSVVTVD